MEHSHKALKSQLDQCKLADRFRFKRRLDRLRQEAADSLKLSQLAEQIDASINWVATRREALKTSKIKFPDLPVSARREEIAAAIRDHQVVVVAGETGSGKTTQLPKICLELGLGCQGLIGHTQPRRLAARAVASRIAEELESELGGKVGYQVRFHDQVGDDTQVKVMTDGILLAETQSDRFLNQYEVLIIDEAHERSLNIDFLLGYLKRLLPKRPDLKLIITSATIDLERFSKHFNNAPVIEVSGRTYPVDVVYQPLHELEEEDAKAADLQQGILNAVEDLLQVERTRRDGGPGDILVFLPGEREIRETADTLRKADLKNIEILPLYARLSLAEQNRVFDERKRQGIRICLSTNVAETSLTVPGIRYVIDPGVARISRYSYRSKVQRLPIEPISQASARQRAGRCGRVASGVCIRLYSEEDFNARPSFTDPEIKRTNLAAVILQMLSLRMGDIADFPFVEAPEQKQINDGFNLLFELGAVDAQRELTEVGRQLTRLPIDPTLGRMVLEAAKQSALTEMLIIVSALTIQDPREYPAEKREAAEQKHRLYRDEDSDFLSWVKLWNYFEEQRQELSTNQLRKHCRDQLLSWNRMREWRDLHRQLRLSIRDMGLKENQDEANYEAIHRALIAGLATQIGQIDSDRSAYLGTRNRRFHIFPGSALFKKKPKWVLCGELVETSKLYARTVAKIDPAWVEPLVEHLVKRQYLEPHWEAQRAQVIAYEQVNLFGLILVNRRKIHFGAVDQQAAHEIFIRQALVEGGYRTNAPFYQHNLSLLRAVEGMEAKIRRRDLLVDEEQLYEFYLNKMHAHQGEQIVNGKGFERWRKRVEQEHPKTLFMTEQDVMTKAPGTSLEQMFPDQVQLNRLSIPLDYRFEPGKQSDGVTVTLPVTALSGLDEQKLEWLVEGMIREKVIAMIKALPKQLRRGLVPVPDTVDRWLGIVTFGQGSLPEALAHGLRKVTGEMIPKEAFEAVEIDDHLRYNIRVTDPTGKQVLGESRSLVELKERFAEVANEAVSAQQQSWGESELKRWPESDLPETLLISQGPGLEVEMYPGLCDQGRSVQSKLYTSKELALHESRSGVARLLLMSSVAQLKPLKSADIEKAVILASSLFTPVRLREEILFSLAIEVVDEELPRTKSDFSHLLTKFRAGLEVRFKQRVAFVLALHQQYHELQKVLKGKVGLDEVMVLNEIKSHLAELMPADYLSTTPPKWLSELDRYVAGVAVRLEKYRRSIARERVISEELSAWNQRVRKQQKELEVRYEYSEKLTEIRWLLEEYRVSIVAQVLGTRLTISEKRLRQIWREAGYQI